MIAHIKGTVAEKFANFQLNQTAYSDSARF